MKKILFGLFIFSLSMFVARESNAQTLTPSASVSTSATPTPTEAPFNFEKAYKDLVFMMDQYNKAHSDYLLAKAQYLQAKTLASQTKARDATASMLISRDDVMSTYLLAIRQRLVESEGTDPIIMNGITARIDTDVTFWKNHRDKIDSAGTLDDLVNDSSNAFKHYPNTEALAYEVLSTIPLGKESALRNVLNGILQSTKEKVSQIRGNGDHNTTNAERWIIETDDKLSRSLDKEIEAQKIIPDIQTVSTSTQIKKKSDLYSSVLKSITESVQYLKDASSYMKEVLKSIKTKQ